LGFFEVFYVDVWGLEFQLQGWEYKQTSLLYHVLETWDFSYNIYIFYAYGEGIWFLKLGGKLEG
jgi:hypothetical protein